MSLPPDLKVLCRLLSATRQENLFHVLPTLVSHVSRCGDILSAPLEQKGKASATEATTLVHQLKTSINTLLFGKKPESRFSAIVLVKAVIDVGGWECLRGSESWVRGLIQVLQKPDPTASKELCVVTLTRIYTLLHEYQTLIREIATPTLPQFANICLQLLAQPKTPLSLAEALFFALGTILPLYPTTLRPLSSRMKAAVRPYIAPTDSDKLIIPHSLRCHSRRLAVLQHFTTPKNGNAVEWASALESYVKQCHITADWIFRAVEESWESTSGYSRQKVSHDEELHGGGDSDGELPSWNGLRSGAQRLVGQLETVAEFFRSPTKSPVTIPIGAIMDLVYRMAMILPPSSSLRDFAMQLNSSIGRDEREELWAAMPDIHVAAMELMQAMVERLQNGAVPIAASMLDETARMFKPSRHLLDVRSSAYTLIRLLLKLVGPSLPRLTVESLDPTMQACCQDLMAIAAGLAEDTKVQTPAVNGSSKSATTTANADQFLPSKNATSSSNSSFSNAILLQTPHLRAASTLLPVLFSHLPQQHLKKADRALLDRTAIISGSKEAMVASALHPYVDKAGRHFANILPFLVQAFPHDADVEILRSNMHAKLFKFGDVLNYGERVDGDATAEEGRVPGFRTAQDHDTTMSMDHDGEPLDSADGDYGGTSGFGRVPTTTGEQGNNSARAAFGGDAGLEAIQAKPLPERADFEPLVLKRKSEAQAEENPAKRLDQGKPVSGQVDEDDDDDSGSEESVHLDMQLEDFEDSSDEE